MLRRDRDVPEDAEAHALVGLGVVTGRADQRVRVVDAPLEHCVDGRDHAARGEQRDLVAARAERREHAGVAAVLGRELLHPLEVRARVHAQHLVLARHARRERDELREQARHLEQVAQTPLGVGVLGMPVGLDHAPGGDEPRRGARVVPEVALVEEKPGSGGHLRALSPSG